MSFQPFNFFYFRSKEIAGSTYFNGFLQLIFSQTWTHTAEDLSSYYFISFQNKEVDKQQNQTEPSPNKTSPSEQKDQDLLGQKQQTHVSNLDLNENYNNKLSTTSTKSESSQSQTPSSPLSPVVECSGAPRIERKLSIEIKKVPLQEGPRSFDTSSSMGVAGGVGSSAASSTGMLQRSHAFKVRAGQSLLTSSSSLSEDSGTEGGGAGGAEESHADGAVLARPNHLPVKSEKGDTPGAAEAKAGHAAWAQACNSPDKQIPKTSSSSSSSERVAPSSSSSSHLSSSSSSSSSTPVRTALSFTNPLHSDNSDEEGDGEMAGHRTNVSTATAVVAPSPHHGDQQPVRKVLPMSIAGRSSPSPSAPTASMCICSDKQPVHTHTQASGKPQPKFIFRVSKETDHMLKTCLCPAPHTRKQTHWLCCTAG